MTASTASSVIAPARSSPPKVESATRWVWQSNSPGSTVPAYSVTSTSSGRSNRPVSTATIRSPSRTTVAPSDRNRKPSKACAGADRVHPATIPRPAGRCVSVDPERALVRHLPAGHGLGPGVPCAAARRFGRRAPGRLLSWSGSRGERDGRDDGSRRYGMGQGQWVAGAGDSLRRRALRRDGRRANSFRSQRGPRATGPGAGPALRQRPDAAVRRPPEHLAEPAIEGETALLPA